VSSGYPILLDVTHRAILLVGGGNVSARKAKSLLEAGASHIRCLSPVFSDKLPAQVTRITGHYHPDHLAGITLCFVATNDPAINASATADCHARNILVSRADVDDLTTAPVGTAGDFTSLAAIRRHPLLVGVSAGGSPLLAAALRDVCAAAITDSLVLLAQFNHDLRPHIRKHIPDPARRTEIFQFLASQLALDTAQFSGRPGLQTALTSTFPELAHLPTSVPTNDK
jgi:siroheme synthase-like protein